jgi:hypothetical protein
MKSEVQRLVQMSFDVFDWELQEDCRRLLNERRTLSESQKSVPSTPIIHLSNPQGENIIPTNGKSPYLSEDSDSAPRRRRRRKSGSDVRYRENGSSERPSSRRSSQSRHSRQEQMQSDARPRSRGSSPRHSNISSKRDDAKSEHVGRNKRSDSGSGFLSLF